MPLVCVKNPLILIGVPRSGTTLVANILDRFGLFIGHRLGADSEARYFYGLNGDLLRAIHGYWDNPAPIRYFLDNQDAVDRVAKAFEANLRSHEIVSYLGLKHFLHYRSMERFVLAWGWKDPQNILTLPVWLRIFPDARIVYIVRNGAAVARSLVQMQARILGRRLDRKRSRLGMIGRSRIDRIGFKGSARCLSLQGSFSLWEEYTAYAESILASVGNLRYVIQYEELLANPRGSLEPLARFCRLPAVSDRLMSSVVGEIKPEKADEFFRQPGLPAFIETVRRSQWMMRYGYGKNLEDVAS
jgi:hypothetical protein